MRVAVAVKSLQRPADHRPTVALRFAAMVPLQRSREKWNRFRRTGRARNHAVSPIPSEATFNVATIGSRATHETAAGKGRPGDRWRARHRPRRPRGLYPRRGEGRPRGRAGGGGGPFGRGALGRNRHPRQQRGYLQHGVSGSGDAGGLPPPVRHERRRHALREPGRGAGDEGARGRRNRELREPGGTARRTCRSAVPRRRR